VLSHRPDRGEEGNPSDAEGRAHGSCRHCSRRQTKARGGAHCMGIEMARLLRGTPGDTEWTRLQIRSPTISTLLVESRVGGRAKSTSCAPNRIRPSSAGRGAAFLSRPRVGTTRQSNGGDDANLPPLTPTKHSHKKITPHPQAQGEELVGLDKIVSYGPSRCSSLYNDDPGNIVIVPPRAAEPCGTSR